MIRKMLMCVFVGMVFIGDAIGQTVIKTQDCGETPGTVTCVLTDDSTYTVSGIGPMKNLNSAAVLERNPIKTIVIENGVTKIGQLAFALCENLVSVTIGTSVTAIGASAFSNCKSLTYIEFPDDLTIIGRGAFNDCISLKSIKLPNNLTTIEGVAFSGCTSLESITIPRNVMYIEQSVFGGCTSLSSIEVVADNINFTSDDGVLFNHDKTVLRIYPVGKQDPTYTIPNSVISIEPWAFYGCTALSSVDIPSNMTTIGRVAFIGWSGLTEIKIPEGVTRIEEGAFYDCANLTSLTIPSTVTYIGEQAFDGCFKLSLVISLNPYPPAATEPFKDIQNPNATLYVPEEGLGLYNTLWGAYFNGNVKVVTPDMVSVRHPGQARLSRAGVPVVRLRGRMLTVSGGTGTEHIRLVDMRGKTVSRFTGSGVHSLKGVPAGRYVVDIRRGGRSVGALSVMVK